MKYPYLADAVIVGKVEELLNATFGDLQSVPVPVDLDAIIFDHLYEHEGMLFTNDEDLGETKAGDAILGITYPCLGRIQVTSRLLAGRHLHGRYRFTVAHELGHWVLHREFHLVESASLDLFSQAKQSPRFVGLARNVSPAANRVPREEWQANRFAALLLVSPSGLRVEFSERFRDPPLTPADSPAGLAATRDLARYVARTSLKGEPCLADTFGVSVEAMAVALEARGYVSGTTPLL